MSVKELQRGTVCTLYKINAPIWNGGKKKVGLAENRLGIHNEIHFTYRRKSDGALSIPEVYYFNKNKLKEIDYERMNIKGLTLVLIPFTDLEILKRV